MANPSQPSTPSAIEAAPSGALPEGARGATEGSAPEGAGPSPRIPSEVSPKADRRRFTADYKRRILAEAEACTEPGDLGKLLRREGLYSSHLTGWRRQRDEAVAAALGQRRGRKPLEKNPLAAEIARLQAENQHLQERLTQAQTIIEVQKKLSSLLGLEPTLPRSASCA
jgi:transposase-like protein